MGYWEMIAQLVINILPDINIHQMVVRFLMGNISVLPQAPVFPIKQLLGMSQERSMSE